MTRGIVCLAALIAGSCSTSAAQQPDITCALPVVLRATLRDIHESWFNGPQGYAFVVEAGAEKVGTLPRAVGRDPVRRFDTSVYASNFQGPVLVQHSDLRPQWEWTAAGTSQVAERQYPLLAARRCAASAAALPKITLHIDEHDEWPWMNDAVGAFAVELRQCERVLTPQRTSGWSTRLSAVGLAYDGGTGPRDVEGVDYILWCYHCASAADCQDGIQWPPQ